MIRLLSLLFSLCICISLTAQREIVFGDSLVGEKGIVSYVLPNKNFWVAGVTDNGPFGDQDIFLVKMDTAGQVLSKMNYFGSPDRDFINNMLVLGDKMIMVGETHFTNHLDANLYIVDTSGSLIQSQLFGTVANTEQFYDAKPTSDGGFIVAGFSAVPNVPGNDFMLAKFDSSFQLSWMRSYDLGSNDVSMTALERPDGGYLVVGDQDQINGNYNIIMMGCDSQGNYQWDSTITSSFNGGCKTMKELNGSIYIVGEISTPTSTFFDIYICKVDWNGHVYWQKTITKTDLGDAAFDLIAYGNDGFLMTGYVYNPLTSSTDLFAMTIDTNGQLLQEKTYGGAFFDMGYDVKWLDSNQFIMTGFKSETYNQSYVLIDNINNLVNTSTSKLLQSAINIYPNPSHGILHISAETIEAITVYNLAGQMIKHFPNPKQQIDIHHLPSNFYICRVQLSDGSIYSQIIQKNRM